MTRSKTYSVNEGMNSIHEDLTILNNHIKVLVESVINNNRTLGKGGLK